MNISFPGPKVAKQLHTIIPEPPGFTDEMKSLYYKAVILTS